MPPPADTALFARRRAGPRVALRSDVHWV